MKSDKLKRRFTLWYIKRGYSFGYDTSSRVPKAWFRCPIWVRPLLVLFSPSVYYARVEILMLEKFWEGFSMAQKETT